jgi:hypothetical protein
MKKPSRRPGFSSISLLLSDLHGNPARIFCPESAQVAETDGRARAHHVAECK